MSISVDSLSVSTPLYNRTPKVNADSTGIELFPIKHPQSKSNALSIATETTSANNTQFSLGFGAGLLTLAICWATKGKIKNFLKARQARLDNELINFIHGYDKPTSKNISALFKDNTTRRCDVAIKTNEQLDAFVYHVKDKLPARYLRTGRNGELLVKDCVELEVFEIYSKGKGHGTKKLQEIIKYAKEHTDGRLCLLAQQKQGYQSPVLFYYKNGLRSFDKKTNLLIEKVARGEEPISNLPSMLPMYLP